MCEIDRLDVGVLVHRVLSDDAEARRALHDMVEEKVCPYLRRIVLNDELASDLMQDAHVEILRSLSGLDDPERFWPWAFRIASNKAFQYFRKQQVRRVKTAAMTDPEDCLDAQLQDGLELAGMRELGELTRAAMAEISERYRMVLALRFYEDMSHVQIAEVMGCSEVSVRTTFFRAKRALVHALGKRGVQRSSLLSAVAAFGSATIASESAKATAQVSAAALSESAFAGFPSVRVKALSAAAIVLALSPLLWFNGRGASTAPANAPIAIHFVRQSPAPESDPINFGELNSKGAYEHWFTFPEGKDGPFHYRMQRWDPAQKTKLCWWVQNEDANYYVHAGEPKTAYVNNGRLYYSSYRTKTLPTDSKEFCNFIHDTERFLSSDRSEAEGVIHERDPATGFFVRTTDTRFPALGSFTSTYSYEPLDPSLFDAPAGMEVVDQRDEMHRRGWTRFTITGELNGRPVTGAGQIPFVLAAREEHPEWLRIECEGRPIATDSGDGAALFDANGVPRAVYASGALFKGLSRPWVGFHTLDTIRRDAAHERIWFTTSVPHDTEQENQDVQVNLIHEVGYHTYGLRYTVEMETDVLKRIEILKGSNGIIDRRVGVLEFTWIQESRELEHLSAVVPQTGSLSSPGGRPGVLWPVTLLNVLDAEKPDTVAHGTPPPSELQGEPYEQQQP